MGTRSTTRFYNHEGKLLLAIYKQYDGYTSGWGQDLINFIKSGKFGNGIGMNSPEIFFNGYSDFVLQVITHFKIGCGGIYATTEDDRQEYNYIVRPNAWNLTEIEITCEDEPEFNQVIKV